MTLRPRTTLLLATFTLLACKPAPGEAPAAAAPKAPAPSPRALDPAALEGLALTAPPATAGRVAQQLSKAQDNTRANPTKADLWVMLAEGWIRVARETQDTQYYAHARAAVDTALDRDPKHGLALGVKAMTELHDHRFAEARDLAKKAVELLPADPLSYGVLADALLELGDAEEAERVTQTLMDLKPGLAAYSRTAHFKWLRGDISGAREAARLAIEASPPGEAAAFSLCDAANMFFQLGDLEGAAEGYKMALGRMGNYPTALVGQARVAMAQGRYPDAVKDLETALSVSPGAEAAWLLGDALTLSGATAAAEAAYARMEALGRTDGRVMAHYLAQKNVRLEEAWALVERELKGRGDITTHDVAAWVLHRQGRHAEALEHITRARRLGTLEARLMFHEGAIRMAAGQPAGRALVEEALKRNPGFDVMAAREARALLAARK